MFSKTIYLKQLKQTFMKFLKKLLLVIAVLISLALLTALFVKKDYAVERQITINKPKQEVFNYVKLLKNQDNYSKWGSMDPAMKKNFKGTDGQPGFVSAWESEKDDVGKGEQEIKSVEEGKRITYELRFLEPIASTAPAFMTTESLNENQTKVTWGFSGHMRYPTNLMLLFMDIEKMIGDDLETGLQTLKIRLEQ
jgi:uncharacterized protein YndB with AHSA1/START domain